MPLVSSVNRLLLLTIILTINQLLLLTIILSPKAVTHFIIPKKIEG